MTTAVGTGQGNTLVYRFFAGSGDDGLIFNSAIIYSNLTSTGFTLTRSTLDSRFLDPGPPVTLVVSGTNFTYTQIGANTYTISGAITGITYNLNGSSQTWSGLNVSAADALAAVAAYNETAFDSLFFSGDDTFTWSLLPAGDPNVPTLYGFGGNDVFNIGDWDNGSGYLIDGGAGNDTINLTAGAGGVFRMSSVSNVENINLTPGHNYTITVGPNFVTTGNTATVDGSALGASNSLVFKTDNDSFGGAPTGNLVLLGGAGNDVFEGGLGNTIFNGGGGNNTVSFQEDAGGIVADLSNTGPQNFGGGFGTGTFINIQNLIGSSGSDVLTGNAGDNVLTVNTYAFASYGNDLLLGGAGNDTAVFAGARSFYTITSAGGTTMVVSGYGTATLTGIEQIKFDDQTVVLSNGGVTVSLAPVITTSDFSATRYQTIQLSSLFSIANPSQEAITTYELWDSNADSNSGSFVIGGVTQPAGKIITLTAAQMQQAVFVSGRVSDSLQIRALNAAGWSAADNAAWAPFNVMVPADNAPVVTTHDISTKAGQQIFLNAFFSFTDSDGDGITKFQLWDFTADPNSGHWVVNGQAQSAGTVITVSDLNSTYFLTGSVSDRLQIRAFDGILWSAGDNAPWSPFNVTVIPNRPPVLTTSNMSLHTGQAVTISNLAQVTDPDNDTITKYQLWVGTLDPNAGYFTVNGVRQPAKTPIEVTAGQLSNVAFVVGQVATEVEIRAFDGQVWSAGDTAPWSPFTVTAVPDHAPMVTTTNQVISPGLTTLVDYLFTVSDADGDAMTKYQFWVGTRDPNAGYFTVNGVRQPAKTPIEVTAGQLASHQILFWSGQVSTEVEVRAFDGVAWSAPDNAPWSPFFVSPTPLNNPPVVMASSQNAAIGASVALSSLFSVIDPDGDTITKYRFVDLTNDPVSGYITINGVPQTAGTVVEITAAQLAQAAFVAGRVPDTVTISAFDGKDWTSSPASATITPPANHAPVVTTATVNTTPNQTLALATLFSVSDADSDTMTKYELWDATRDANSGHFAVGGVAQAAGTIIDITAAQLAQTSFMTGTVGDNLQIRAFDGIAWSASDTAAWSPFTISVPANHPPVLTTSNKSELHGTTLALSSLLSVSDADGDTVTKYELWDATRDASSGHFVVNGVVQAAGTIIDITAARLSQTSFVTGSIGDNLQIRAFDGVVWSASDTAAWSPFSISVTPNSAPVVTTATVNTTPNQTLALSGLFSVNDADGDIMTRYELWDATRDASSGHFVVNGAVQAAGTIIDITAAQLSQTSFVTGTVSDNLQIRAFDGYAWSAGDTAAWAPFTVSIPANHAPMVTTSNKPEPHGATLALSSLFSVSDADGDTMTKYELWDATRDANSGHFVINGVAQAAGTIINVTAGQLVQTSFVTGSIGDNLQIRAFDGRDWSAGDNDAWAPFTITVAPNSAPVLTTVDKNTTAGQSLTLSSLFSVSDADSDTMTRYELWDATRDPNSGDFVINGAPQAPGMIIDVTAAQLAQTSFLTGTVGDSLQIRAFDGFAWSAGDSAAWAPFHINVS